MNNEISHPGVLLISKIKILSAYFFKAENRKEEYESILIKLSAIVS